MPWSAFSTVPGAREIVLRTDDGDRRGSLRSRRHTGIMSTLTRWPPHALRATIVAPLSAPLLYSAGLLALDLLDPARQSNAGQDLFRNVAVVFAFGAPIAYGATILVALPAIWLLAGLGRLTLIGTILIGSIAGLAVGYAVIPSLSGDLFRVRFSLWAAGAIGAVSAGLWWRWAVR